MRKLSDGWAGQLHKAQLLRKLSEENQPSSLRRKDSCGCNILGSSCVYSNKKREKQHSAFFGMLEMNSDGYVVSCLHEINKRQGQSLAGGIPTQHCAGQGSSPYSCTKLARARKGNRGSAAPEVTHPNGSQHIFSQLNVAVIMSVGLQHRESKSVSSWRVGATGLQICLQNTM